MAEKNVLLSYGSGGRLTHQLIDEYIVPNFSNNILNKLEDSGVFNVKGTRFSFTTDSYVVDPIFFPGGDIGKLAVCGTVNDLSMSGAVPLYLSCGFIIEEGFSIKDFELVLNSMRKAAKEAGIDIITGDTKVVHKGKGDKIFVNTSGIGIVQKGINVDSKNIKNRDKILINGTIGDHGTSVLARRENIQFKNEILSDVAPLNKMVKELIDSGIEIHTMKDPTRGGIATSLKEIAEKSNKGIEIFENKIPVREEVKGLCEILGFDPIYIANEGKLILFTPEKDSEKALNIMKKSKYGKNSEIIGSVINDHAGKVILRTTIGGSRIVDMLSGEQLPRIC
ncbi:hydrogenase expression/formation protein HypE [candidate division KSB1 bacterium]